MSELPPEVPPGQMELDFGYTTDPYDENHPDYCVECLGPCHMDSFFGEYFDDEDCE